jgi:peptide/nickel transport system substrate-binding protein
LRRTSRGAGPIALALSTAALVVVAGCTTSGGGDSTTSSSSTSGSASGTTSDAAGSGGGSADTTITYAAEQDFYAYNTFTVDGNATANQTVLNQVLRGFSYVDNEGAVQMDTEFGTIEKTSDDPLTVQYTFADEAKWSDGEPIGCADFLLTWAAGSGYYNKDGSANTDGRTETSENLFDSASTTGLDQTEKPTCADGDKTVTLTYKVPYVDWNVAIGTSAGGSFMPAHVAAEQAGTDTAGLVAAFENDDAAVLTPVAEFWNTGWTLNPDQGLPDASLIPASGPYLVSAWEPGQSITLTANPEWWGTPPASKTVVMRFIDQSQQVSALQSGEVDVIEPQANPDSLAALEALGSAVDVQTGPLFTYEHLDLNVNTAMSNEKLREAFFNCVPRQQIVDNLIKPSQPDAEVLQSLMLQPTQPGYDELAAANGFADFTEVDLDAARAAFAESGAAQGTTVRIIHIDPNPRRTNEVALIKASCDQIGFNIQDTPLASDAFGAARASGDYDVALFAWAGSGLYGSISAQYASAAAGGEQNTAGWADPAVDAAFAAVNSSTDTSGVVEQLLIVDKALAENFWSIPLFAFPGLVASNADVSGVKLNAGQTQATWNMQEWARS